MTLQSNKIPCSLEPRSVEVKLVRLWKAWGYDSGRSESSRAWTWEDTTEERFSYKWTSILCAEYEGLIGLRPEDVEVTLRVEQPPREGAHRLIYLSDLGVVEVDGGDAVTVFPIDRPLFRLGFEPGAPFSVEVLR